MLEPINKHFILRTSITTKWTKNHKNDFQLSLFYNLNESWNDYAHSSNIRYLYQWWESGFSM